MSKAEIARQLGVPYSYICTTAKVIRLMEEKNMSLEELINTKAAKQAPKGSVFADSGEELDAFGMPAPKVERDWRIPSEHDTPENVVGKLVPEEVLSQEESDAMADLYMSI